MSYQTYTTEALVCGTFNRNTADRSYLLFIKEAGMLYAEARSVREERSKQRYSLQDFSLVRVSLIKGKSSWKIGSIEAKKNFYTTASSKEARGSVVLLTRFLRRFLSGQEAAPDLFDYIAKALFILSQEITEREFVEQVLEVRVLLDLGYVDDHKVPLVVTDADLENLAQFASPEAETLLQNLIDKAVSLSHL